MKSSTKRITFITGSIILATVLTATGVWLHTDFERQQKRKAEIMLGAALYAENCASCHGADLKGEANWQSPNPDGILPAPPHDEDGHTWHHSDRLLTNYIKLGGERALAQDGVADFKSGMAGFEGVLSDAEISAVLEYIKSRWPQEIRAIQQERTKTDEELNQ